MTFPAVTAIFFHGYTADGYMLAMLLATLAVYVSRIGEQRASNDVLSIALLCLSCGIYQAFIPFAFVLALCYFIYILMEGSYSKADYAKWIRNQILIFPAALGIYYAIWKICMYVEGVAANEYLGINEVGRISLSNLRHGMAASIETLLIFIFGRNIFKWGLTSYTFLHVLFVISFSVILWRSFNKSGVLHRKGHLVLALLSLFAIIPGISIWQFTSESLGYGLRMLSSISVVFIFALLLCERYGKKGQKFFFKILMAVIVYHYAVMANVSYYHMDKCYEQTYAKGLEMMYRIHALDSETELRYLAVIGRAGNGDCSIVVKPPAPGKLIGEPYLLYYYKDLICGHGAVALYLKNIMGLELEPVDESELERLGKSEAVEKMDVWPAPNSVKAIGDTAVIKLFDLED